MNNKKLNIWNKMPIFNVHKNLEKITKNISNETSRYLNTANKHKVFYRLEDYEEKNNNSQIKVFNDKKEKNKESVTKKDIIIEDIEGSENMSSDQLDDIILEKIIFFKEKGIDIENIDLSRVLEKEEKLLKKQEREEKKQKNQKKKRRLKKSEVSNNLKIKNTKKNIDKTLSDNFPILSASRIKKEHNVVNIQFGGIKNINDNISKEFADFVSDGIKDEIENNFRKKNNKFSEEYKRGRKIHGDYKNLLFSLPDDFNIEEDLFGEKDIGTFINKVLNKLYKDKNKLNKLLENNNLEKKDGENIEEASRQFIVNNFSIGVGKDKNTSDEIKDKMESLYKATFASKEKISGNIKKGIQKYDFQKIIDISEILLENKSKCIENHKKNFFSYDGGEKLPIIVKIDGEEDINETLKDRIKKGKEITFHPEKIGEEIVETITEYLKLGNDGFYFLMPTLLNDKGVSDEIENRFKELNKSVKTGVINAKYFTKNYKGFHTKKYLEKESSSKRGLKIFVDVIGNGNLNLKGFIEVAKKIKSGADESKKSNNNEEENNNSEAKITEENINEIMHACDEATQKVISPIKEFLENYPQAIINIAGDEVFIFIPGATKLEEKNIIKSLSEKISKNGLKARIVHSLDNDISYDNLDFLTYIHKYLEEKLGNNIGGISKNIILNISDELKKDLLYFDIKKNFINDNPLNGTLLDESSTQIIKTILNKINFNSTFFKDFIKNKDETKIYYNKSGITVEITKKQDREDIEINIFKK